MLIAANIQISSKNIFKMNMSFWIVLAYLYVAIIVETVNGIAIHKNIGAISTLISGGKLIVVIYAISFILSISTKKAAKLIVSLAVLFLLVFVHQVFGLDEDLRTINVIFKIFNNLFYAFFAYWVLKSVDNGYRLIKQIVTVNYSVLVFNILIGAMGIGFSNYKAADDTAIGGTGYLPAGNEVGVALLLGYLAMLFFYRRDILKLSLILTLSLLAGFIVLSKSTIIGIMLISLVYLFQVSKLFTIALFTTGFFTILVNLNHLIGYFQLAINRWTYLIRSYGWEPFLLGGNKRVEYISLYLADLSAHPIILLSGVGWKGETENNFFDLIQAFGISGLLIFLAWVMILLMKPVNNLRYLPSDKSDRAIYRTSIFCGLLVLLILILAGHTVQSSLVAPFLAGYIVAVEYFKFKTEH